MADNRKYLWKAYGAAFLGLILGLLGMHRFYLGYTVSGILMLLLIIGGVGSLLFGYITVALPVIEGLYSYNALGSSGNFNDIPDIGQLGQFSQGKWYYTGYTLCGMALFWFMVDLLRMPILVRRANNSR